MAPQGGGQIQQRGETGAAGAGGSTSRLTANDRKLAIASEKLSDLIPRLRPGQTLIKEIASEIGVSKSLVASVISIDQRKIYFDHKLLRDLSDERKSQLNDFVQATRDLVDESQYPTYSTWVQAAVIARGPSRGESSSQSEPVEVSNLREPGRVEVAAVPFQDSYNEGMESRSAGRSTAANEQLGTQIPQPSPRLSAGLPAPASRNPPGTVRTASASRTSARSGRGAGRGPAGTPVGGTSIAFEDFYNEGMEFQAEGSSTAASDRPRRLQSYEPSPGFFSDLPANWQGGSSSGAAAPTGATQRSSPAGAVGQSPSSRERTQDPVRVDAPANVAGVSVTATQQSASPAPAQLNDDELGIIEQGLRLDGEHLRNVEDLAAYSGIGDLERVRPYVLAVGDGESARLEYTAFGRESIEKLKQEQDPKRARHKFVYQPAVAQLQRVQPRFEKLRIGGMKPDEPPKRR
ncbi:MAG TPA: hypothetical protein VFP68_07180 [Burkholderiaceae bacterium]|nr:hypothetical protein [Burkholderiaceae bacterium]